VTNLLPDLCCDTCGNNVFGAPQDVCGFAASLAVDGATALMARLLLMFSVFWNVEMGSFEEPRAGRPAVIEESITDA